MTTTSESGLPKSAPGSPKSASGLTNSASSATTPRVDPEKIRSMFAKVAPGYDRANTILSAGIHHLWRRKLVQFSRVQPGMQILDCATGTGDLAIEFKKRVGPSGKVIGTDFCAEMMQTAPAKAQAQSLQVDWQLADVTALPYPDKTFDVVSISFGIRNVADRLKALSEMARVTKPGGRVMILEFGQIPISGVNRLYEVYSKNILPKLGGWITGQTKAYEYLQDSSANFPCREDFLQEIDSTGKYSSRQYYGLTLGIAYIYEAVVK